jgi:hypothetical protein
MNTYAIKLRLPMGPLFHYSESVQAIVPAAVPEGERTLVMEASSEEQLREYVDTFAIVLDVRELPRG